MTRYQIIDTRTEARPPGAARNPAAPFTVFKRGIKNLRSVRRLVSRHPTLAEAIASLPQDARL